MSYDLNHFCLQSNPQFDNVSDVLKVYSDRRVGGGGGGGGGGSRGSNEPPLEVNNGGLKTQIIDFQLLANSGEMENKLWVLQFLKYPARKR